MAVMTKKELRTRIRSMHEGRQVRDAQSAALCRWILQSGEYRSARVIGGYMPLAHEADILPVLQDAVLQGKMLALPLCDAAPVMTMRRVRYLTDLTPGAYGIPEPSREAEPVSPEDIDLLLVPLEGIDREGFRLGKGGGYYDRLLKQTRAVSIGCALTWQWVEKVARDSWDRPLDACADRDGLHYFKR